MLYEPEPHRLAAPLERALGSKWVVVVVGQACLVLCLLEPHRPALLPDRFPGQLVALLELGPMLWRLKFDLENR